MPQITPTNPIGQLDTIKNVAAGQGTVPAAIPAPEGTEAAPVEKTGEDPLSPKLVELARRTRAQRQLELKLKAQEQALAQREAEIAKKATDYETNYVPVEKLRNDLLGVLTQAGYNREQLVQALGSPQVGMEVEVRQLREELKALKQMSEQSQKQFQERDSQQYEQALNQIRMDAKALVDSDPSFETIKATNSHEAVAELIKKVFDEGYVDEEKGVNFPKGTILSVEQAAQKVEDYLLEEAIKMANLKKVKEKLSPPVEEIPVETPKVDSQNKQGIKTLTNTMSAQSSAKKLSAADRRARAIAMLEGRIPPG